MTLGELRAFQLFRFVKEYEYKHQFVKDLKDIKKDNQACAYLVIPIYLEKQIKDKQTKGNKNDNKRRNKSNKRKVHTKRFKTKA